MVILYAAGQYQRVHRADHCALQHAGCIATFRSRDPTMRNTDVGTKAEQRALHYTSRQATQPVFCSADAKRCHIESEKFFDGLWLCLINPVVMRLYTEMNENNNLYYTLTVT